MSVLKLDRLQAYVRRLASNGPADDFWVDESGAIAGRFGAMPITSAFQSIHRLDDGSVVGAQALVRRADDDGGAAASPWVRLASTLPADDIVALDRRSRTVHTLNFFRHDGSPDELFLSVHDRLLTAVADNHGRSFRRVLETLAVPLSRIVIELPAETAADPTLLANVVANYRLHGFKVAANFDTAAQLAAVLSVVRLDYLKVDAQRWPAFDAGGAARPALARMRASGTELILKRVETGAHLDLARACGASRVQGYALAAPVP
ncbi:MAG: EAL domain-containing protein, partial [Burkholderiaceae bacterium]